jgi:transmembrane sensor
MTAADSLNQASADRVDREAVAWAMRHENGEWSDRDAADFEQWCAADPRHPAAYRDAVRTLSDLSTMGQMEEFADLMPGPAPRERLLLAFDSLRTMIARPRVRAVWAMAAAAALALIVHVYFSASVYTTGIGEIRTVTLEDGTVVTLSAASRIDVAFSKAERHVNLARGEAFFAVTKNPVRPFIVAVGETVVRVVGTKFDVHRGPEDVRVAVLEGVVEVRHPADRIAGASGSQNDTNQEVVDTLAAGRQIIAPRRGSRQKSLVTQVTQLGGWRSGRLDYDGATLREVIADINRYYPAGVELESEDLGNLKVTSSFRPSQIDQMIDGLTLALPIEVERREDGEFILRRRR